MIHPDTPPKTRTTWGLSAVGGREAAQPILSPVDVVYAVPNPSIARFGDIVIRYNNRQAQVTSMELVVTWLLRD